jgi:hypothetical protein
LDQRTKNQFSVAEELEDIQALVNELRVELEAADVQKQRGVGEGLTAPGNKHA